MTTTSAIHPDEVLKALLAKGNRRDKDNKLRKLHELCALEYSRHSQGARDFSIANMSRVAESHGIFKARTIYNRQSSDYAALFKAWQAYNGTNESKLIKKQTSPADKYAFLKTIVDPAVRTLCMMALIERDKLRAELNLIKAKTRIIVDMRPLGAEHAKDSANVDVIEPAVMLTDSERNALSAAIDPKTWSQRKWRLGATGEVLDEHDRFIFFPGMATGIAKILGQANASLLQSKPKRRT